MILVKEKDNLYPFKKIVKISKMNNELKSLAFFFINGTIVKFIFDNEENLNNAYSKLEKALLIDKSMVINQEWLGAKQTTCNI